MAAQYELLGELASGGMAKIYLGRQRRRDGTVQRVAIKSMRDEIVVDPDFRALFDDEADIAKRIVHPNVVPTFDVVSTSEKLLIVMEYIEGVSLSKLLGAAMRKKASLPIGVAARILVDVLSGLHAAHELVDDKGQPLSVVHRDVSPENILIGVDGRARLVDFGIAKATTQRHVTAKGQTRGKLSYMSPEQQRGRDLDRRSDVYSAGIVLWEALVGRRLFSGNDNQIAQRVLTEAIPPPSMRAETDIPPALDRVVMNALARAREARWDSAARMGAELEAAVPLAPHSVVASFVTNVADGELAERAKLVTMLEERPPVLEAEALTVREALTKSERKPARRRRRRAKSRRTLIVYALIGVAVGLALLVVFMLLIAPSRG